MLIPMDFPMTEESFQTRHPDTSKQGVRISLEKYELVRAAILAFLRARGALNFGELGNLVEDALLPTFDGSVMWYYTTVKLDLEARGEIRRVTGSKPQKLELVLPTKGN